MKRHVINWLQAVGYPPRPGGDVASGRYARGGGTWRQQDSQAQDRAEEASLATGNACARDDNSA